MCQEPSWILGIEVHIRQFRTCPQVAYYKGNMVKNRPLKDNARVSRFVIQKLVLPLTEID